MTNATPNPTFLDPEPTLGVVPRRSLAEETYLAIRHALLSNQIQPGQRLVIDTLAREMQVSITPVRQALTRLNSEGFVSQEPYKGYVASPLLDRATVVEIYDARTVIESEIAGRAAARLTDDDFEFLTLAVAQDPLATVDPELLQPGDASMNYDEALHRRIALAGGNSTLVSLLDGLVERMRSYRNFYLTRDISDQLVEPSAGAVQRTRDEHREIVDALRAGDKRAAEKAMRRHLLNAAERNGRSAHDRDSTKN